MSNDSTRALESANISKIYPGLRATSHARRIQAPRAKSRDFHVILNPIRCLNMNQDRDFVPMGGRFRSFLPVVVDVETGGFNHQTDALLQIAAVTLRIDEKGTLSREQTVTHHIEPFEGANMDPESLKVNGIDPHHPLRLAIPERDALSNVFKVIRNEIKKNECTRAILVGHNAAFDLNFLNTAVKRSGIKRNPFHQFSNFDTVSLAGMAFGQTVLARAVDAAKLGWNSEEAHSAIYDAEKTADLFCHIINRWQMLETMQA